MESVGRFRWFDFFIDGVTDQDDAHTFVNPQTVKSIVDDRIYGCNDSAEMISLVEHLLPNYPRHYCGIKNTGKGHEDSEN